jgi:uncharacterized membrane protein HdeD (DUF308 family)
MRDKARRELARKEGHKPVQAKSSEDIDANQKTPSFISGFFIILFGSIVFSFFFSAGEFLLGVLASAAFIIIGMSRIFKASAARAQKERLSQ